MPGGFEKNIILSDTMWQSIEKMANAIAEVINTTGVDPSHMYVRKRHSSPQAHKSPLSNHRTIFKFRHEWDIDVPAEIIWRIVSAPENWPSFVYGFSLSKKDNVNSSLSANSKFFFKIKGSLPYSLSFHAEVLKIEPEKFLVVKVGGDLKGVCRFDIGSQEKTTKIIFVMNVSPVKCWIKLLAPAAKKFFVRNHNFVVDRSYNLLKNKITMEAS